VVTAMTWRTARRRAALALAPVTLAGALLVPVAVTGSAEASVTAAVGPSVRSSTNPGPILSMSTNGVAWTAAQADMATAVTLPAAKTWWGYNTFVRLSRSSGDVDYDFSAKLVSDMAKVSANITRMGAYLNALAQIIQLAAGRVTAANVVSLVSSILIVVGMSLGKWRNIVKRFTFKGKHAKDGFWSKTLETLVSQAYLSSNWRSCPSKTVKCGSPGTWRPRDRSHGWVLAPVARFSGDTRLSHNL
jgi:hypothetical protein